MPTAGGFIRGLYDRAPSWVRGSVRVLPFGWRIGRHYRQTLAFLQESDRWDAERLKAYQDRSLDTLLTRAIRNVPYYARYRNLLGKPPRAMLEAIEPIEKKDIQADPERFLDPTVPRSATYLTMTGGTSGYPLNIILDKSGFQIEWAFMIAQWMRVGFRPGLPKAKFRGQALPEGRLWLHNPVYDELQFSPFKMSEENLALYVKELQRYKPQFLYGYPSALTLLARYIESHPGAKIPQVKALLCGSENVRDGQREFLERVFDTRFYSWYGMSEKVILAGECERSTLYHAFPQYGVTEVRDAAGNLSSHSGSDGELVGTGFMNTAMPFIRYRLGDYSRIVDDACTACGRPWTILGPVRGRWVQEMILGRSGAEISLTALNMHGEVFAGVLRFQFRQIERGRATLRIVSSSQFAKRDAERIRLALTAKTGDEVEWRVEIAQSLELTDRGKGVFLVRRIPGVDTP